MRPILPEPDLSERVHDAVLEAICSGELKAGARITQPAYAFPGGRRFHFEDPDGYELAVWSGD